MHRSFDRRVEVVTPVIDPEIKGYLRDVLLPTYLKDQVNAHTLLADGNYKKTGNRTKGGADAQQFFIGKDSFS